MLSNEEIEDTERVHLSLLYTVWEVNARSAVGDTEVRTPTKGQNRLQTENYMQC